MNSFANLSATVGELSASTWHLLKLERDVTLHQANPERYSEREKSSALRDYRMFSIAIFGEVRSDRK